MHKIWRIMQGMNLFHKILILLFGVAISVHAVPPVLNYAGQVAVNGEAFDGNGLFKFALVNADGTTTYWSNDGTSVDGSEPQASVAVPVNGGLYSILLGNTAQQGMGAIDPAVFAQHTDAKLRVWFSDGVNGFQQLSPDRPFASVPYAFNSVGNCSMRQQKLLPLPMVQSIWICFLACWQDAVNERFPAPAYLRKY